VDSQQDLSRTSNLVPLAQRARTTHLLVGGGCGVAPLLFLAKTLNQQHNIRPTILIGGRSKQHILRIEDYIKYGKVLVMTEDGSMGDKGLVTQHPIFQQEKIDQIYCCGPDPMMKAVAQIALDKNIPCQISLENTMACGIGACLCCVTQTKEGHKCVCTEGPVFDVKELY
jgi:dihydroorotate dehydrogenase electron transfer subunit